VARSNPGDRNSILHQGHLCHCYVRADSLACAVICDEEYPQRVAFSLIYNVLEQFLAKEFPWKAALQDTEFEFRVLDEMIQKYQNPSEADKLMKIQKDIDATRDTVIRTIDQLLERGQKYVSFFLLLTYTLFSFLPSLFSFLPSLFSFLPSLSPFSLLFSPPFLSFSLSHTRVIMIYYSSDWKTWLNVQMIYLFNPKFLSTNQKK
jgi:hypothetical protein